MMQQIERQRQRELEYIARGCTLEVAMMRAAADFPIKV